MTLPCHLASRIRISCLLVTLFAVTFGFAGTSNAQNSAAQNPVAGSPAPQTPSAGNRVTLTRSVQPSFHIEPIVHRFAARRGAVIPFEFLIRSTGKEMDVSVLPVKLRQEESGIILHDDESEPAEEIKFVSETSFHLSAGESFVIKGEVTVPLAKSNFLSYGVLVRDNGQLSDETGASADDEKTSAAIRFVTQYVLRIDIETGEKDLSEMNQLVFDRGRVRTIAGMPVAESLLVNPTNFAFECQVRGEVESPTRSRAKPFRMGMSSRANLEDEEKYLVRIMPNSRVRVFSPIEDMLFPGNQVLKLSLSTGRRTLNEQDFAVNISGGDFPALETKLAYLSESLSVSPAQIQLGQIAAANRTTALRFTNSSTDEQTVQLSLTDLKGNPIDHVRLSSDEFSVRAGRSKSVRATLNRNSEIDRPLYGRVKIATLVDGNVAQEQRLPLALLFGAPAAPSIQIGDLQSIESNGHTSFRLAVTNNGKGFVPLHADLQIADTSGHVFNLGDGYGKWMEPGETRELKFNPEEALPPVTIS